jgi:hypothetical protein
MLGAGVDFAVLDEAAIMAKGVWETIVRPTLMDRAGGALLISTPRGRNWFYYLWERGQDADHDGYKSWRFPSSANPFLPESEIEEMKHSMPLVVYQQEVLADFISSAGSVFRFNPDIIVDKIPAKGHIVVGIDLAKSQDFTVLSAARAIDNMPCGYDRFNDIAWVAQRNRIKNFVKRLYRQGATSVTLVVDSTGVGDPIAEELENDGYDVVPINFSKPTIKQSMVIQLSKDFEDGLVRLDKSERISEFENYTYKVTDAGKWTYSAPEGQHDDCVSAKMMCHWGIVQEGMPNIVQIGVDDSDTDAPPVKRIPWDEGEAGPEEVEWENYMQPEETGPVIENIELEPDSIAAIMSRPGAWAEREGN